MLINFILFKLYIEKYNRRSDFRVTKDTHETIVDFGKYRLYVLQINYTQADNKKIKYSVLSG